MKAYVGPMEYVLPERILSNDELAKDYPDWPAEKIWQKIGIRTRHIAADGECSSDLAFRAATKLFDNGRVSREQVDFVLLCTLTPDYIMPTTACVLQNRLGLSRGAGALDFNLGCSGYVYGLSLAKGLIETGQAKGVLLLTGETLSKVIHPGDKNVRTVFGDAASATFIGCTDNQAQGLGPFVFGTDGSGAEWLIVRAGGMRQRVATATEQDASAIGPQYMSMNGPAIYSFTLEAVPAAVEALLARACLTKGDIDYFVFHQANRYMLEQLRKKIGIDEERFLYGMEHCGNTVSSSIPIVLADGSAGGRLHQGQRVMLVGFGVGLSWAACLVNL